MSVWLLGSRKFVSIFDMMVMATSNSDGDANGSTCIPPGYGTYIPRIDRTVLAGAISDIIQLCGLCRGWWARSVLGDSVNTNLRKLHGSCSPLVLLHVLLIPKHMVSIYISNDGNCWFYYLHTVQMINWWHRTWSTAGVGVLSLSGAMALAQQSNGRT